MVNISSNCGGNMDEDKIREIAERIQEVQTFKELHDLIIDYAKHVLGYVVPKEQEKERELQEEFERRAATAPPPSKSSKFSDLDEIRRQLREMGNKYV